MSNKTIKEENNILNALIKRIDDKENKELFKKYLIAIQDIYRFDKLESYFIIHSKDYFINFNKIGLYGSRYVDNIFSQTEIDDRRSVFLDKVKNIPNEIKQMFDIRHPNLLTDIEQFIAPNPINPS